MKRVTTDNKMTKCAKCDHDLRYHQVGQFTTSKDNMSRQHYGVSCNYRYLVTLRCGCTAGFDHDVIVTPLFTMDEQSNEGNKWEKYNGRHGYQEGLNEFD
jgi:hypothetical protein